jgi:hypothetical protein
LFASNLIVAQQNFEGKIKNPLSIIVRPQKQAM